MAEPTTIRVVQTRRALADLTLAGPEELALILDQLKPLPELEGCGLALNALPDLVRYIQGPCAAFLHDTPDASDAVLARILLASPAVRVVLVARGRAALDEKLEGFHTRPATRVRAIENGRDAALAPEEPAAFQAVAVDPLGAGSVLGQGARLPPVRPFEAPADSAADATLAGRGFSVSADLVAVFQQTRAAVAYYFSGAAAVAYWAALPRSGALPAPPRPAAARPAPRRSALEKTFHERTQFLHERLAATEIIATDAAAWTYELGPYADICRAGGSGVFGFAATEGRESPRLEDFLESLAIRHAKLVQIREINRRATAATARARLYLLVVEDKFGAPRCTSLLDALRQVAAGQQRSAPGGGLARLIESIQANDPDAILAQLTGPERALVEMEYASRLQAWKAAAANKCPHVGAARLLRAATSAEEALAALRELEGLLADSPAKEGAWLMCRSCGFRALCPHVRERVRLEARRVPSGEVRTQLLRFAVGAKAADLNAYYCHICAERIADIVEDEDPARRMGRFGDLDAGLRTKIWSLAVNAARAVRFPVPTDERQFAGVVTEVVHPLLLAAEEKVHRRRRATADDGIDPRTLLYAALFVYAFILDLVVSSPPSAKVGFAGVRPDAKPSAYAERILHHAVNEQRRLISQVEDITADFIKARFAEAYRVVRSEGGARLQVARPEEELAAQTAIDPTYRYAAHIARLAGALPLGRPAGPAEARREFETVLGATLPELVKRARESSRLPELAPLYSCRPGVEIPGGDLDLILKDPRVHYYARMYELPRGAASLAAHAPKAHAPKAHAPAHAPKATHTPKAVRTPVEHADDEVLGAYRLFAQYTKRVTGAAALAAYRAELAHYNVGAAAARATRRAASTKIRYDFGFASSRARPPPSVEVTARYDENGERHEWVKKATYIYANATGELSFVGREAVVEARAAGKLAVDMVLIDVACSVCGVRASAVGTLDASKTSRALRAASESASFFIFYESRCPEGDLHGWNRQGVCGKCGISTTALETKNAEAQAYFEKYAQGFAAERRAIFDANTNFAAAPAVSDRAPAGDRPAVAAADWKPDYTVVVRAAKLAGVTPATIEAIGSTEAREYVEVVEGRNLPPPVTSGSDPRIYAADAETRLFLSDYSAFRAAAADPLPALGADYHTMLDTIIRTQPASAQTFAVQSLCRFTLEAAEVAAAFVTKELALILRGQKLLAKPGPFNWGVFEGLDDITEEAGDVGEDVLAEMLEAGGEEAPDDPFSGESIDYDTSDRNPNNDPA